MSNNLLVRIARLLEAGNMTPAEAVRVVEVFGLFEETLLRVARLLLAGKVTDGEAAALLRVYEPKGGE